MSASLADRWRDARPRVEGVHLDSAACSRQTHAVIDAAADHARREAEIGGYVAAEEAAPVLHAGKTVFGELTGRAADDVIFTTGANNALDLLLGAWPQRGVIACIPGEFAPNLAVMAAHGFGARPLPTDDLGRVVPDELATQLAADPPALVHLTVVPSHRGVVQPLAEMSELCRRHDVALVVDAAQALGQVDCRVDADAVYAPSRKWLAGPRGVGALAVHPDLAARLTPRIPPPAWLPDVPALALLEHGENNLAARVGFSCALQEHVDHGPQAVRERLSEVGAMTRAALSDVPGWRVVEPVDSPVAITTLDPTGGADVVKVRAELIARHAIVTTVAGPDRAPFELSHPVLRLSPHVDLTAEDLGTFAAALEAVS